MNIISCSKPSDEVHIITEKFIESRDGFATPNDAWGDYKVALSIEAIITYTRTTGDTTYIPLIDKIFHLRGYDFQDTIPFQSIPFSDPYYAYYTLKRDPSFINQYLHQAREMQKNVWRSEEGAVGITHNGQHALLIDYIQDVGSRMARAGKISGNPEWMDACVDQFELYRLLLRYPSNGLYSQGRGWLQDSSELSPSCWSRGQGWLIRGMVESLQCMEKDSEYYIRLQAILKEFAEALLEVQDKKGMWHTLPCRDMEESYPEVSGTSLIAYYLATAYSNGILTGEIYRDAAIRAIKGVKKYIDNEGNISHISKGPGTLRTIEPYFKEGELNDPHGFPAVLFALTGEYLLKHSR